MPANLPFTASIKKIISYICVGKSQEKHNLRDPDMEERIRLKWLLEDVRDVLSAVKMSIVVFWVVTPCSL
jgi:hypothetical protein